MYSSKRSSPTFSLNCLSPIPVSAASCPACSPTLRTPYTETTVWRLFGKKKLIPIPVASNQFQMDNCNITHWTWHGTISFDKQPDAKPFVNSCTRFNARSRAARHWAMIGSFTRSSSFPYTWLGRKSCNVKIQNQPTGKTKGILKQINDQILSTECQMSLRPVVVNAKTILPLLLLR